MKKIIIIAIIISIILALFVSYYAFSDKSNTEKQSSNPGLVVLDNSGEYGFKMLESEFVKKKYISPSETGSFLISEMTEANAVGYGDPIAVEASVMKFDAHGLNYINRLKNQYDESTWDLGFVNHIYSFSSKNTDYPKVAMWVSDNFIIVIEFKNSLERDDQRVMQFYLSKYPVAPYDDFKNQYSVIELMQSYISVAK